MDILREFLNAFWLRPEVALIKTHEYLALQEFEFTEPSLDLGCGDGIFSFISAGGRFGSDFDMYQNVALTEQFFQGADVFDHFDPNQFKVDINKYPEKKITYGLDHKASLLEKAKGLKLYEETIVADGNKAIPLPDQSLNTIFCNIIYVLDTDVLFPEFHRILRRGGKVILQLPESSSEQSMVYHLYKEHGWEWARLIDRNKYATTFTGEHEYNRDYWDKKIERANFRIAKQVDLRPDLVHKMWDIGLRPLFPALMEMYKRLAGEDRREVKKVWVDTLYEVLLHFCEPEWMYEGMGSKPAYRMVALQSS